jgi:hypothetical protein
MGVTLAGNAQGDKDRAVRDKSLGLERSRPPLNTFHTASPNGPAH